MRSSVEEADTHQSEAETGAESDPVWNPRIYSAANLAGALVAFGFGVAILITARSYSLVVDNIPGPGLYPMIIGIAMTVLAVVWAVGIVSGRHAPGEDTGSPPERGALLRALLALLSITGFVFALEPVGYPVSAAFLVFVLVLLARGTLRKAVVGGPLFGIASYLLITSALGVPLGLGVLEPLFA